MPLTLLTGPHQAGKSRRLWELLRAEKPGAAVLVRPGGLDRELVRQVHTWCGPGWMPTVLSLPELAERAAAALGDAPQALSDSWVRHALRRWCIDGLAGSPWERLAPYRRTARELADLLLRLDAQHVSDADLDLLLRRADDSLAGKLRAVVRARRWLRAEGARRHATTPGARWAALADAPLPWSAIYCDDVLALTPAEAAWLAGIARQRAVVIAAVDDERCAGGLLERLRIAAPDAVEERFSGIHEGSPHAEGQRQLLPALLPPGGEAPLPPPALEALDRYRYRDPVHAGRALAAWMAARHVPPAQVNLYLRACDGDALALADALRAAGVPVAGRFHIAYGATAEGAAVAALGRYLARPSWARFRDLALRVPLDPPPTPLIELDAPWRSVDEALKALTALASKEGSHGDHLVARPLRPALAATAQWLAELHARLPTEGTWFARLAVAAEKLDLPLGPIGPALAALDALHPVDEDDLIDALADASIEVARDDGPASLAILDAVRGRSQPRAVAVLHGLEHGRWPVQSAAGVLLGPEDRAQIAADWFDERGRTAGELAALLACAGRGLTRLVVGIPCGERQPSAWLATIAEQAGWKSEQLRGEPDAEAVAGAPLGVADSRGAHEQALWTRPPRQPSLEFQVPPRAPDQLGLRISSLDYALGDSFALVCQRLALGGVLQDRRLLEDGNALHDLLAGLVAHPPEEWPSAFELLLDGWIGKSPDEIERAARRQRAARLRQVVAAESDAAAGAEVEAEAALTAILDLGALGVLPLNGRADRIDRHDEGTVTVIDYKRGAAGSHRAKVEDGREAQVLAYVQALRAAGENVRDGVFVPLAGGKRVAISLEDAAERWAEVCASVAALAGGSAAARIDGACPPTVIRAAEYADPPDEDPT